MSSTMSPGAAVPQMRNGPPCCPTISLCSTEARRSEKTGAAMVRALSQSSVRNGSAGRPYPPERFVRDALVNAYRTATWAGKIGKESCEERGVKNVEIWVDG